VIAALTASTQTLSYDQGQPTYCPSDVKTVTFTVKASDAGGIATATLYWREPGASVYAPLPMTLAGGNAQKGTWTATLGTAADGITSAGSLAYYVIAQDASGAKTKAPASGAQVIPVSVCPNTGPTFVNGPSAGDATLYADPLKVGCGSPLGTEIRATITDVDGVASANLVFTDQSGATTTRPMQGFAGDLWTSFINANDDGTQGPGSFTFQVVAVDSKGATTTSDTKSIRVVRCDTPASFDFGGATTPVYNAPPCTPTSVTIPVYASDADNGGRDSSRLQVVVSWRAANLRGQPTFAGDVQAVFQKGNSFLASFPVAADWTPGLYLVTYYATSTDIYGGTSKSFTGKTQISVYGCQPLG
jgi:hypothetical protein